MSAREQYDVYPCGCTLENGTWFLCAKDRALGDLDAVLHAAPPEVWRSISGMRDYLLAHGVRVVPPVKP